jgi:hypothetical protein
MLDFKPGPVGQPVPWPLKITTLPLLAEKKQFSSNENVPSPLHIVVAVAEVLESAEPANQEKL